MIAIRHQAANAVMAITACGLVAAAVACLSVLGQGVGALCSAGCLDRRLQSVSDDGLTAREARQAQALILRQLGASPFDDSAWLRQAALAIRAGRLTAQGSEALDLSYRYAPVDAQVARWRTAFVFNHWPEVSQTARSGALREVRVLFPDNPEAFRSLTPSISDAAGAMAYRFLLAELQSE